MDLNWEEGGCAVDQCMYVAGAGEALLELGMARGGVHRGKDQARLRPAESERLGDSQRDVSGRQPASWVWSSRKRPGLQAETWGLVGI